MPYSPDPHSPAERRRIANTAHDESCIDQVQTVAEKIVALLIKELGEAGKDIACAIHDSDDLSAVLCEYAGERDGIAFLDGISAGLKTHDKGAAA